MNKKTIIILCSSLIGILILILLIAWIMSITKTHYYTYEEVEAKIIDATKNYYKDYPTMLPVDDGDYTLLYSALEGKQYIKPLTELLSDGASCTAEILVSKFGETYNYIPYLNCPEYESKELYKIVLNSNPVKTTGAGLYQDENGQYYFKGEINNNYVSLGTIEINSKEKPILWRIMSIDSDGTMKLKAGYGTNEKYVWDNRYNTEKNNNYGYNDFEKSRLKETLINLGKGELILKDYEKSKLVAKNLCVGKRSLDDTSKDGSTECATLSEDKYIFGTQCVYEFLRASLDDNCKTVNDKSCANYNYLANNQQSNEWSITASPLNSYQSYSFDINSYSLANAYQNKKLYLTININNHAFFKSGTGYYDDPYILK